MVNDAGNSIAGVVTPDHMFRHPVVPLGYGRTYTLTVASQGPGGKPTTQISSFSTLMPRNQTRVYLRVDGDGSRCCATLILSMVATLCVPTESSGFVRHREDDVKPSPACDCRQRSRWCGEEHRLHQFWVTRIQPERAGKGRSRRPPVISTISGHAERVSRCRTSA